MKLINKVCAEKGHALRRIMEYAGNMAKYRCTRCGYVTVLNNDGCFVRPGGAA